MSTILGGLSEEPSEVGASSPLAAARQSTRGYFTSQESLETLAWAPHCGGAYHKSLEDSSKNLSASLNRRKCDLGTGDSVTSLDSFCDALEDSRDESDATATVDSDTGSFYSVESYRKTLRNSSAASLVNSEFGSEITLYDSAQSLNTPRNLSHLSLLDFDNSNKANEYTHKKLEHSTSLCTNSDNLQGLLEEKESSFWEYTSCPDLYSTGRGSKIPAVVRQNPKRAFQSISAISSSLPLSLSPPLSPLRKILETNSDMSAVSGATSLKVAEDSDKKKKGLMSPFRKGRKTGRKFRQQKKVPEGGISSPGSGVTSDTDQEYLLDSESSVPNSPALVKSNVLHGTENEGKGEESEINLDTLERLNGSSSPKGSDASSKTPSPVTSKSNTIESGVMKVDEKAEKKKEKTKFGSFLVRKDKKQKPEYGSKFSIVSNTSAASFTTDASMASTDAVATSDSTEMKTEEKANVKGDMDPLTAESETNNTKHVASGSTDAKDVTPSSNISTIQFIKNLTVNAEIPAVPGIKTESQEDTSAVENKKLVTSPNGKPSTSEATSSADKREHLYKILVIGELGTGKTSIIKRYVHQFFSQHYRATIGVDFALKVLNWDSNTVIRLQLWDIAGQERFGNMTRVYYKEAVGAFVVFDVTRAQTFDAVTKWKTDLDTKVTLADGSPIPTVLLANKCDQPKEGVVNNPARMDDYCRERGFSGWFETSAKENINIDEASRFLVNKILSNEKQGMMMTESMDNDKFSVDGKTNSIERSGCRC
ncbi:uncharacterized protein [Cherax quadricarinatus]|uniref:uncharacterized protein isoform X2 n=1 Tax=Cherax quadricarinatus TaxID=27406 RepID=UPI00387E3AD9